jgi:hypothetical protein
MIRQLLKLLLLCLVLPFSNSTCFAQFTNSNEPRDGRLKGKIDSVVITYFNIKTGGVKELNDRCTDLYNVKGLLTEERISDYDEDAGPLREVYNYDDNGNYSQSLHYNSKSNLTGKVFYTFDSLKRIVETKSVRTITGTLQLDKTGNVIEDITYHEYPTVSTIFRYKYNRRGLCIESHQTWAKSSGAQQILYTYNADNNLIKEVIYNNGPLLSSYTYSYPKFDEKHNWLIQNKYRDGHLINVAERVVAYRK